MKCLTSTALFIGHSTLNTTHQSGKVSGMTLPVSNLAKLSFGKARLIISLCILILASGVCFSARADNLVASWYSVESLKKEGTWRYSNGIMANGHLFNDDNYTCATRLFPLGSRLLVKNLNNGKSVVVITTDSIGKRFAQTRIDLSKAAFARIADLKTGLIPVSVEKQ